MQLSLDTKHPYSGYLFHINFHNFLSVGCEASYYNTSKMRVDHKNHDGGFGFDRRPQMAEANIMGLFLVASKSIDIYSGPQYMSYIWTDHGNFRCDFMPQGDWRSVISASHEYVKSELHSHIKTNQNKLYLSWKVSSDVNNDIELFKLTWPSGNLLAYRADAIRWYSNGWVFLVIINIKLQQGHY